MSGVNQPIEDGLGDTSAAEILVPVAGGQLRRQDRRTGSIAFLDRLEQILLLQFTQAASPKSSITSSQQRQLGEFPQKSIVRSLCTCLDEVSEQRW